MTKIQEEAFMPVYRGTDVIGKSHTGSGKTLAFGLPLIEALRHRLTHTHRNPRHACVLILEPTRELAKQVHSELSGICVAHNITSICVYGGTPFVAHERAIRKGAHIIIGTPGRLVDLVQKDILTLVGVSCVAIDEADYMLSLGFNEDVERLLRRINTRRAQVLLFSATTPAWVQSVVSTHLKNATLLDFVKDSEQRTVESVSHIAIQVPDSLADKATLLGDIIQAYSVSQAIVFVDTRLEADDIAASGALQALASAVIHGDIGQDTREHTMKRFRNGNIRVLVATNVVSRGIDVSNTDLVLQCSPPFDVTAYIHRSGRTGRMGRAGVAVTLFSHTQKK